MADILLKGIWVFASHYVLVQVRGICHSCVLMSFKCSGSSPCSRTGMPIPSPHILKPPPKGRQGDQQNDARGFRKADRKFLLGSAPLLPLPVPSSSVSSTPRECEGKAGIFPSCHHTAGRSGAFPSGLFLLLLFCSECLQLPAHLSPNSQPDLQRNVARSRHLLCARHGIQA